MKKKLMAFFAIGFLLLGTAGMANAVLIDFTALPAGSVSTIGDVTFSLAGVGEAGDPYVDPTSFGGGLWNSSDGPTYPTNTILRADFAGPVTDLFWTFDNEGGKTTTYTIYDSSMSVLASGFNDTSSGFQSYDFSALTDVMRIEWNNLGNNWLFALGEIEYEGSSAVPEPSTMFLLGLGMVGLAGIRRKIK